MSAGILGSGGIGKLLGLGTGTTGQIANATGGYLLDPANFSGAFGQNYGPGAFLDPNGTGGGLYPGKSLGSIGINASPLNGVAASIIGGEFLGGAGGGGLSSLFGGDSSGIGSLSGSDSSGQGLMQGLSLAGKLLSSVGGGGSSGPAYAPPFQSNAGSSAMPSPPAGSLAGMPYYGVDAYANYGPNAPNRASFAPPVGSPPSPMLNPAGLGATASGVNSYLSAGGGGPATTPIDNNALQQSLNAPSGQTAQAPAATGSSTPQLAMQDASGVGNSYLQYLEQLNLQKYRPTYAAAHNSAVGAPTFNPLAPNQSSPIAPPQLTV